jgi:quercetin dioxygenase-like cupin family protein
MEIALRILRFQDQIATLKKEPAWQQGERVARTLVKQGRLSVVLTLMRAGAALREHRAEGAVTIQCLTGRMILHAHGTSVELTEGEMAALDSGIEHSIDAVSETAFLLTIAQ